MKIRTCLTVVVMSFLVTVISSTARAELPENYLKRWDDPAVQEAYRRRHRDEPKRAMPC